MIPSLDDLLTGATQKLIQVGAAIGLIVAVIQQIVTQKHGGWWPWLRGAMASIFVGVGVNLAMADWHVGEGVKIAVVSFAVYCADDVLLGLKTIAGLFANNPFDVLQRVRDALAGGKAGEKK